MLEEMPIEGKPFLEEYLNDNYESPYHIITKYNLTKDTGKMEDVASVLIKKQFTASMKDKQGKLPLDSPRRLLGCVERYQCRQP